MNTFETTPFRITKVGGGSVGENLAGYLDEVRAGTLEGLTEDQVEAAALVTVADDGGATGRLRKQFGVSASGDARRSISALADNQDAAMDFERRFDSSSTAETVQKAGKQLVATLSYGKTRIGSESATLVMSGAVRIAETMLADDKKALNGIALGHLILTHLELESDIDIACRTAGDMMGTRAEVIPVSIVPHFLKLRDGYVTTVGEHKFDGKELQNPDDFELSLCADPGGTDAVIPANPRALEYLAMSDQIAVGPGSVLTSTLAAVLPDGIPEQLRRASAADDRDLILLGNIKTQDETKGWKIEKFANVHGKVIGAELNVAICNSDTVGIENPVVYDADGVQENMSDATVEIIARPIVKKDAEIRHDPNDALAAAGMRSDVKHDMKTVAQAMNEIRRRRDKTVVAHANTSPVSLVKTA